MKAILFTLFFSLSLAVSGLIRAEVPISGPDQKDNFSQQMSKAVGDFVKTLNTTQRAEVMHPLSDTVRFNWHFIPRDRAGLNLKRMSDPQRKAAMRMIDAEVNRQAAMIAYVNDFYLMMWMTLAVVPFTFLMRRPNLMQPGRKQPADDPADLPH